MDDYLAIEDKTSLVFNILGPGIFSDEETEPDHKEEQGEGSQSGTLSLLLISLGFDFPYGL